MIPDLTHLQFVVLTALLDREHSGRDLRAEIAAQGQTKTLPAFYQLMARMEDAKLVEGRYELKNVGQQVVKERRYKIVAHGLRAWEATRDFYMSMTAGSPRSAKVRS